MSYTQPTPRIKGGKTSSINLSKSQDPRLSSSGAVPSAQKHIVAASNDHQAKTNVPPPRSLLHQGIVPILSSTQPEVRVSGLDGVGSHSRAGSSLSPTGSSFERSYASPPGLSLGSLTPSSRSRTASGDGLTDDDTLISPYAAFVYRALNRRCAVGLFVFGSFATLLMCLLTGRALYWKVPLSLLGLLGLYALPWLMYWKRALYSKDSSYDALAISSSEAPLSGDTVVPYGLWSWTRTSFSMLQFRSFATIALKQVLLQMALVPAILILWSYLSQFDFGPLWLHPDGLYGKPMLHPNVVVAISYAVFLSASLSASILLNKRYKAGSLPNKSKDEVYGCPRLFMKGLVQAARGDVNARAKVLATLILMAKSLTFCICREVVWAVGNVVLFSALMLALGEWTWRIVTLVPSLLGHMTDPVSALIFWRRWSALQGPGPLDILRLLAFRQMHILPGSSLPLIRFAFFSGLLTHALMRLAHGILVFVVLKWPLRSAATHEKRILFPLLDGLGPQTAPSVAASKDAPAAKVVHLLPLCLAWRDMAMALQTAQPELAALLRSPLYADWEGKPWLTARRAWSAVSAAILQQAKARAKFLDWAVLYFDLISLPNRPSLSVSSPGQEAEQEGGGMLAFLIGEETSAETAISRDYTSVITPAVEETPSAKATGLDSLPTPALFEIIFQNRLWLKRTWPTRYLMCSWLHGQVIPAGDDALRRMHGLPYLAVPLLISSHQVMTEFVVHSYKEDTYGIVQRDLVTFLRESLAWMQFYECEMERGLALLERPLSTHSLAAVFKRAFPWLLSLLPESSKVSSKDGPWAVLYRTYRKNLAAIYSTFEADLKTFGLHEQEFLQWKAYAASSPH